MLPEVSFVIPLYNEEEGFAELTQRLDKLMDILSFSCEVVLIDDGSKDRTTFLLNEKALTDSRYHGIFLSKNHGHQVALTAGLYHARASKAIMILDGDLQDPPELIHEFIKKLDEGYDVIYGVRSNRQDTFGKKLTAWLFYRLLNRMTKTSIPIDTGDFAMLSRKALNYLNQMPERSRYIRGMRSWIGFRQTGVEYERHGRFAGATKYSVHKMMSLAYDAVFSFSELPVKLITRLGLFGLFFSIAYTIYIITKKLMGGDVTKGFTTLILVIVMFSCIQLICLGILGEYMTRVYKEVQQRPLFVIDKMIADKQLKRPQ